ncbi:MAG: Tyrosine recombinase XerD [Syntrophomonadaceae bacterium]|nr:Tyrosine recombinase XerD [Bacillota bacterium]
MRSIQHVVFHYAREAGLENVSCHSLRHTFGTFLQKETGDLALVAQLMGHRSIQTTTRYTRRRQEDLDEAVERSSLNMF